MISNRQLAHALTLFRHGNFTRAAAESHLSQSAFSRSIRGLEKELGVMLFDRYSNSVVPTVYGKALLRRAEAIIADTEELEREIRLIQGLESGSFSVALGIYPAEVSGNQAVGKMVYDHPDLHYRISLGTWQHVNKLVLSRRVDLGFAATSIADTDEKLVTETVGEHEMLLYCRKNHPLSGCAKLSKQDLDQFPLVSIRIPGELADTIPGKSDIDYSTGHLIPSVEVDDLITAQSVVANSNGIGVAFPIQIASQLESGDFKLLGFKKPWLKPSYGFIFLRNRSISPAAEIFMKHVFEIEKDVQQKNQMLIEKYCV